MANDDDLPSIAPTRPGIWRHYKGGLYQVIDTARHSETREPMTVYRALYGARGLWVRPAAMFAEEVVIDGTRQARFAWLHEAREEDGRERVCDGPPR